MCWSVCCSVSCLDRHSPTEVTGWLCMSLTNLWQTGKHCALWFHPWSRCGECIDPHHPCLSEEEWAWQHHHQQTSQPIWMASAEYLHIHTYTPTVLLCAISLTACEVYLKKTLREHQCAQAYLIILLPSLYHITSGGRLGRSGTTTMVATRVTDSPSVPNVTVNLSSKVTSSLLRWIPLGKGTTRK